MEDFQHHNIAQNQQLLLQHDLDLVVLPRHDFVRIHPSIEAGHKVDGGASLAHKEGRAGREGGGGLIVEKATLAVVEDVEDVACPVYLPPGVATNSTQSPTECLKFNNTVYLHMVNEADVEEQIEIFEQAMLQKIADGWLRDNFNLEEALKPPPPNKGTGGGIQDTETVAPQSLGAGAIVAIIIAVMLCFAATVLFVEKGFRKDQMHNRRDGADDLERQEALKVGEAEDDVVSPVLALQDHSGPDPSYADDGMSVDNTAERSYTSQEPLLNQNVSSSNMSTPTRPATRQPTVGEGSDEGESADDAGDDTSSEMEAMSIYSAGTEDHIGVLDATGSTPLAAMATASTLVARTPPGEAQDRSALAIGASSSSSYSGYSSPDRSRSSSYADPSVALSSYADPSVALSSYADPSLALSHAEDPSAGSDPSDPSAGSSYPDHALCPASYDSPERLSRASSRHATPTRSPTSQYGDPSLDHSIESPVSSDWASAVESTAEFTPQQDFPSEASTGGTGASPPQKLMAGYMAAGAGTISPGMATSSAAVGRGGGGTTKAAATATTVEEDGGISARAAAAIGAVSAGVVAGGAYLATRDSRSQSSASASTASASLASSTTEEANVARATGPSPDSTNDSSTPSAMEDLDNAIESGNWGQVGALAAVLASQRRGSPRKKSQLRENRAAALGLPASRSDDSSARSGSRGSVGPSLDQARAVEIDRLVEAGDWQGVVLAAARFEADQTFDGTESGTFSASGTSRGSSSRWTGSASSAAMSRSRASGATSQSASNQGRGLAEIRAEVEALVRRVVPEEADNIDEMMTQFRGREEELVETLRRMQERAIASRARLAVQKSAKLEARAKAGGSSARGSSTAGAGSSASVASQASMRSEKSELEQAIEAGNWQAVGVAAQKMSDASVGDLSLEEKARLRDAISQSPAFGLGRRRGTGTMTPDDFNLDELIERGDWPGVIAAAKAASEGAERGAASSVEERDALAQASMWQEIADQSKQGAQQGPAGAGDAAAWAIQRSLQAMDSSGDKSKTVRTIHDIADEQDSDASQYESSSYGDSAGRQSLEGYGGGGGGRCGI